MEKLPALCPACFGKKADCQKCQGLGEITVTIPDGDLYTLECQVCGHQNGGRIMNDDLPFPENGPDIGCIKCDAPKESCRYVKVGELGE